MQYGSFDDERKEYVILKPNTPRSWSNYLGTTRYGAIITNNAGGYSFFRSAAQGRFTRTRFNNVPADQPGRYFYLRDKYSGEYWSNAWMPVGKSLDRYKTECRHGTAYTRIQSEYDHIQTDTCYFVPLDRDFEIWHLKVTNRDERTRLLNLFNYVEYANNWNALDDQVNLQYTQYILQMRVHGNILDHGTNVNIPPMPDNFQEKDQGRHTFLALAGAEVLGYETDREQFLGPYRTYANPVSVENGRCTNSLASGDNGCGVFQFDLEVEPDETKDIIVIMGVGTAEKEGEAALREFGDPAAVEKALEELKDHWHSRITGMAVHSPDQEVNSMLNVWNPYNCMLTYMWSRAASLIYAGERDGLAYRDTIQDMLGVMHLIPDEARERLELMITGQVSTGGAMPVVKQFAHHPGKEKTPAEEEYRSDDCLWLFNAVPAYVKESGDLDFYKKVLPYADKGKATVLGHLRRAIEFNLERSGSHNLACGLSADWNDCLQLGQKGESVFVSMQLRFALDAYREAAELLDNKEEVQWARDQLEKLDQHIQKHAWDGEWFLRAYREDGRKYGSKENEEGTIFLNPQSWSVISGIATPEQARKAMDAVQQHLSTPYGLMICAPPYVKTDYMVVRATLMNPGMKENAGIFQHTQGWAIMAESTLGRGNQAFAYYKAYLPAACNTKAEIRQIEPYVYSQSTHSKYSPRYGASRIPWLSGSATWAYYAATQYILGIRPEYDGLKIVPCIPKGWKEFSVRRLYRGKLLYITIRNPKGKEKGVKEIRLNGTRLKGQIIPPDKLKAKNKVEVVMG